MQNFINTERKLKVTDIAKVEKLIGRRLPTSLKAHYLEFNGGRPENYIFSKEGLELCVRGFYPMLFGNDRFEDNYQDFITERNLIPSYLIPFADDPGGDLYCMSIEKFHEGSIWSFHWDDHDDLKEALHLLADSLDEFLAHMQPDTE